MSVSDSWDYPLNDPISKPIAENKQMAKRFYGKHQYYTTRAWNVLQSYIQHFSRQGDTVLDPFGGSGVTAVEALILGRKGIHVDITPLSIFLAETTAIAPVDLVSLDRSYQRVKAECESLINHWYSLPNSEIGEIEIPYWYPRAVRLPQNADVEYVEQLFTPRQLISLALLRQSIMQEQNEILRSILLLAFSATLIKTNRLFVSAKGRKESRGGASIFSMYRYYIPPNPVELHVWEQFALRYRGVRRAKEETNLLVGSKYSTENFRAIVGSATELSRFVEECSIDYIFTDPPYGSHIAYIDLSTMFHAWLNLEVSTRQRQLEAIEGGDLEKTEDEYFELMERSFDEMFKALKYDRWMSVVFAHKDTSYWNAIVKGAERAGFEYVNTVPQNPQTVWSMHKKKNPLTVLAGNLILNFRKVKNPRTIAITHIGADTVQVMKNTAEVVIVRQGGSATTDEVVNAIIVELLEHGLLTEVKTRVGDIAPLLQESFVFSDLDESWQIPKNTKLGSFVPLSERIRYYLTDRFRQAQRKGELLTFDILAQDVLPQLINGETPDNQTILGILRQIAYSQDQVHWELRSGAPSQAGLFAYAEEQKQKALPTLPEPTAEDQLSHSAIIYRLAKLGHAAGYRVWIGKQEQREKFNGEAFLELSIDALPVEGATRYIQDNVQQIDVIWLDHQNHFLYAFEVEHSTTVTSAIQRFVQLLKIEESVARNLVIVAPTKRRAKVMKELKSSTFVGHPLYMENKVRYAFYSDLVKLYSSLSQSSYRVSDIVRKLGAILRDVRLSG